MLAPEALVVLSDDHPTEFGAAVADDPEADANHGKQSLPFCCWPSGPTGLGLGLAEEM
jgi:hypothetical protein